jgi:hypothetical protein
MKLAYIILKVWIEHFKQWKVRSRSLHMPEIKLTEVKDRTSQVVYQLLTLWVYV